MTVGQLAAPRLHYAWVMVAVTFVVLLVTAGIRAAPGALVLPFEESFGWDRGSVSPTANLTARIFGRASVGTLFGWIFFAHMVGAALAAWIGGVARDALGDYTLAFLSAGAVGLIAAGFSLGIRRPGAIAAPSAG